VRAKRTTKGLVSGVGALFGQIVWILLFYFLFNLYGYQILRFTTRLMPMSLDHESTFHYLTAVVIFGFAWVVMGFLIDNILRLVFIGHLKKMFGFQYTINEILILLAIMAGIAAFGFWGMIIGPSVLALTLAAANLFSSHNEQPVEQRASKITNTDSYSQGA